MVAYLNQIMCQALPDAIFAKRSRGEEFASVRDEPARSGGRCNTINAVVSTMISQKKRSDWLCSANT